MGAAAVSAPSQEGRGARMGPARVPVWGALLGTDAAPASAGGGGAQFVTPRRAWHGWPVGALERRRVTDCCYWGQGAATVWFLGIKE